jgi:hypothetical protein
MNFNFLVHLCFDFCLHHSTFVSSYYPFNQLILMHNWPLNMGANSLVIKSANYVNLMGSLTDYVNFTQFSPQWMQTFKPNCWINFFYEIKKKNCSKKWDHFDAKHAYQTPMKAINSLEGITWGGALDKVVCILVQPWILGLSLTHGLYPL